MAGRSKAWALTTLAAALMFAGPSEAWRYREVSDQIGNRPTEQSVAAVDLRSQSAADFRCTNATDVSVYYQVAHIVSDDELAQLRGNGAKLGIGIWPDDKDEAILLDTRFERGTNGRLIIIGYGPKLLEVIPTLMRMNLTIGFVLDVPARESYSFQSMMLGVTVEQFIYFAKGCKIIK